MVTGVKGMYCRQCPEHILGDVLQTRGVLDASVAYLKGVLTVKFDPGIVSEERYAELWITAATLPAPSAHRARILYSTLSKALLCEKKYRILKFISPHPACGGIFRVLNFKHRKSYTIKERPCHERTQKYDRAVLDAPRKLVHRGSQEKPRRRLGRKMGGRAHKELSEGGG